MEMRMDDQKLPEGRIELTTWYLALLKAPAPEKQRPWPESLIISRVEKPPIHFYRYLYNTIGSPWVWWERKRQDDETIRAELHGDRFEFFVPYYRNIPAGMIELNNRAFPEVQLNYFGIVPDFCGRGLGMAALEWSIRHVRASGAARYWLHTCSLDSPAALPVYQKAGFRIYDTVTEITDDPALDTA
jgi:GNAT superfamily N-acetyltransferase